MSLLVLEINDAGILASPDDTGAAEACPVSPGYALVEGGRIVTGTAAVECARIKPKHIHNRFWTDLDSSPLSHPLPADLSTADLAHAHLTEIWSHVGEGVTDVILALPGTSSQHQLGLTLGIARACGIPVTGMVDAAVAAAANGYPGDRLLHLDLQLHRVVATELAQNHDIARQRVQISRNTGLAGLHDAWARRVAEIFVGRTRFDPLHSASSEQELYSALLDILGRLGREQRATCELRASGGTRSVELTREDLVGAVAASYEVLLHMARSASHGEPVTLLLSSRVAALPGLAERLAETGPAEIITLPAEAAARGARRHHDAVRSPGEALPFVMRLPSAAPSSTAPRGTDSETLESSPPARTASPAPTHLVHAGLAYPLGGEPLLLGSAPPEGSYRIELGNSAGGVAALHCSLYRRDGRTFVESRPSHGLFLNGRRIEGRVELAVGDRLRLGSPAVELQIITLRNEHGAASD